jgi:hypothetical protein
VTALNMTHASAAVAIICDPLTIKLMHPPMKAPDTKLSH